MHGPSDATVTTDEASRLAALRRYRILDTDPEQAFDDLTMLASHICGTPIALISLIDADRQWFKSRVGITIAETSRSVSFCTHAIKQRDLYVVPDARAGRDVPRQSRSSRPTTASGSTPARRWSTPDGHALGTLCVLDRVPRTLTRRAGRGARGAPAAGRGAARAARESDRARTRRSRRATRPRPSRRGSIGELRESLDNVKKLSALLPFCSACQFDMTIPADPRAIPTVTDGVLQVLREQGLARGPRHARSSSRSRRRSPTRSATAARATRRSEVQCVVTCDDNGEIVIVVRDPGAGLRPDQGAQARCTARTSSSRAAAASS